MKKFKMRFTPEASRLLSRFHPENKKLIKKALLTIHQDPYRGHDLQEELKGLKSFRSNRYRIIYDINEKERFIQIYYVDHRRDIYEQFQRLLNELQKSS